MSGVKLFSSWVRKNDRGPWKLDATGTHSQVTYSARMSGYSETETQILKAGVKPDSVYVLTGEYAEPGKHKPRKRNLPSAAPTGELRTQDKLLEKACKLFE